MSSRIVVVGSANTDLVVKVQDIPQIGETVIGGTFIQAQGGKGANQAVAAARLGGDVAFVARLGRDEFGQASVKAYQADHINTDYITWDEQEHSGVALILVNQRGDNLIAVASGANSRLSAEDVQAADRIIREADVLLVQLEIPLDAVQSAVHLARKHHIKVILNPAPAFQLPKTILNCIDYLTPNESELTKLTGLVTLPENSLKDFFYKIGVPVMVVTLGARGALIIADGIEQMVPGYRVDAIDTVAAGDAFNGALAVAISRGDNIVDAIRFSNAAAAISVTRRGAQSSLPTLPEVKRFQTSYKN